MKIRNRFVSNSSSSSFCILGVTIDRDIKEKIESDRTIKLDIQYGIDTYLGEYIAGLPPVDMKDDETLAQFKTRIQTELNKVGVTGKVGWMIEGGVDD